jgi:hypothetical protein
MQVLVLKMKCKCKNQPAVRPKPSSTPHAAAVKDFFSLKYTPPGAISAGISCPLHITFSPLINEGATTRISP